MRHEVEVDYSSIQVPFHFTKELLSHIPKASQTGARVLDLGCGNGLHQPLCEQAGYEYVGIDYGDPGAPMFADAHRLPFADESFDFVMSMAVLEHLQFPFVAMQEVQRVLKPGGVFLGTVAFLEPFHGNSYFHHTHMGTLNSLVQGGLQVEFVCPSTEWGVLEAQAAMGLFPRVPGWISKLILLPVKLLHRLWWQLGRLAGRNASEHERIRTTTGSFYFRAHKP